MKDEPRTLSLADLVDAEPMVSGYVRMKNDRIAHQREYLPLLLPLISEFEQLRASIMDLNCGSPDSCGFTTITCTVCCLQEKVAGRQHRAAKVEVEEEEEEIDCRRNR